MGSIGTFIVTSALIVTTAYAGIVPVTLTDGNRVTVSSEKIDAKYEFNHDALSKKFISTIEGLPNLAGVDAQKILESMTEDHVGIITKKRKTALFLKLKKNDTEASVPFLIRVDETWTACPLKNQNLAGTACRSKLIWNIEGPSESYEPSYSGNLPASQLAGAQTFLFEMEFDPETDRIKQSSIFNVRVLNYEKLLLQTTFGKNAKGSIERAAVMNMAANLMARLQEGMLP